MPTMPAWVVRVISPEFPTLQAQMCGIRCYRDPQTAAQSRTRSVVRSGSPVADTCLWQDTLFGGTFFTSIRRVQRM